MTVIGVISREMEWNLRHRQRHFPICTAEETAVRHAICSTCDQFAEGKCAICGCSVKRSRGMLIKNKAVLKTEKCLHKDGSKWPAD
jgi:hypothetical protein